MVEVGSSVVMKERWTRPPLFVARRAIESGSFLGLTKVGTKAAVPADDALFEDVEEDAGSRARATISRRTMLTAGAVLGREARQMGQRGFAATRDW
jgi:hypothetical protein